MSDRPSPRRSRQSAAPRPSLSDEAAAGVPVDAAVAAESSREVEGVVAAAAATRSGEDTRRRGWFWHWNSIVTQYAPLIGLKGVGLLNSYTVWTDRRDESPTRGYAFPSQQSEADFYGEDRAELITINKLLVALDLIEIRKEMVLRVDEQGRRWKVPHNFYRVKDHSDGSNLTSRDVLNVAELADRDTAVYRYTRRVFSSKFAPIDRDNVWTGILAEVRETEVWQRLSARTQRDEQRASQRTKAGHAARKGALFLPESGDSATSATALNDTATVDTGRSSETSVASANTGFATDVAGSNTGLTLDSKGSVAPANGGGPSVVDQTNRTYNQSELTTTTTTPGSAKREIAGVGAGVDSRPETSHRPVTNPRDVVTGLTGAGPGGLPEPDTARLQDDAYRAFEDANGRPSTPAERQLLRGLAERFQPAAATLGEPGRETGWAWLTAAIYEAVEAGSAFVAPRRLREILTRWEREGTGRRQPAGGRQERSAVATDPHASVLSTPSSLASLLGVATDFELPHGFGSRRTWEFTVSLLGGAIEPARLTGLVRGTAIVGYRDGEVVISAPERSQAERIAGEYSELIARKLGEAMRRPVRLAVLIPEASGDDASNTPAAPAVPPPPARPAVSELEPEAPSFVVAECGLPSRQVWAAVLDEVAARGDVSAANIDAWLRSTRLIGRGDDGRLIVGAVHALAQRRIAARFASPLRSAAAAILGAEVPLEIVVQRDWLLAGLASEPDRGEASASVA